MVQARSVAVVGGGLIGISCALSLSREGHRVTVFEEGKVGHGCSWGNGAQYNAGTSLPMSYPGVTWRALRWLADKNGPIHFAARELPRNIGWLLRFIQTGHPKRWEKTYTALNALNAPCAELFKDLLGDAEWVKVFRPSGALHVYRDSTPGKLDDQIERLRMSHGAAFQEVSAEDIRELEPNLSKDYQRGIFFPGSGYVDAPVTLVERLEARAASFDTKVQHARVLSIEPGSEAVTLHTTSGPHRCDIVVIAAGIASRDLARSLDVSLSLTSERGYHVALSDVAGAISRPVTDTGSAIVATPLSEELRVVGIAEFDRPDAPFRDSQTDKLLVAARRMLPDLQVSTVRRWMGIRPSTPDSLPVIGPHPKNPAILFATGHGHLGISGAPMTAALISDIVAGRRPRIPLTPYGVR
ncbi:NAD(P)/FAD-dependent oxidoreductase [Methylobacterium nodulans]|uniref:FAD dependent oxidoreductase n=1 Tax=Methylobacterium nodulans (strain LMG 21967 / CNCM I-2342 / ORS 2060) TaxID=460265 RepID=B8ISK5_METNO|nr:FAD-binding oxidoreductase [Methylobacterium nodulans]ACL58845.1 FAD dependent oxidoreductase [Methylobacterium nodulans ORS 2060]